VFQHAIATGHGEEDFAAVIQSLQEG